MYNKSKNIWRATGLLVLCLISSCKDKFEGTTYTVSDEMTITETLASDPERFSMYTEILEKTGYDTSLHSYGEYTCFAPTNEAVEEYIFDKWNVTSVDQINTEEQLEFLKTLVKFHTLNNDRRTDTFVEGRINDTTFTSDFLTTSYLQGGGISNILINRYAGFDEYDIEAENGVVHALTTVLDPYIKSVVEVMEEDGAHTIFVQALKATGYYDDFNTIYDENGKVRKFTLFAESDEVYANEGINSYDDLVARVSPNDADYTNIYNDLNRYVGYHAVHSFFYLGDLAEGTMPTILDKNAIKVTITDGTIKLNENKEENEEDNTWTSIVTKDSNYPSKNGVYHTVNKFLDIFIPPAEEIIFDVISSQDEYKSKEIASFEKVVQSAWKNIYWSPEETLVRYQQRSKHINYDNNFLDIGSINVLEFVTPVIPVGRYEFLVSSNTGNNARAKYQIYWDGQPIGSIYDLTRKGTSAAVGHPDDAVMEENGYRKGLDYIVNNAGVKASEDAGKYRFIISRDLLCSTQSTHVIRFETIKSGNSPIDYFQFIPITE